MQLGTREFFTDFKKRGNGVQFVLYVGVFYAAKKFCVKFNAFHEL